MRTLLWPARNRVSDLGHTVVLEWGLRLRYLIVACACLVERSMDLRLHGVEGVKNAFSKVQIFTGAVKVFKPKLHVCTCHQGIHVCIL